MMRVELKISGGFRTPAGAATFCPFRGYLPAGPKRGRHALAVLREAPVGQPFMRALP
jgi:hypothetical protein